MTWTRRRSCRRHTTRRPSACVRRINGKTRFRICSNFSNVDQSSHLMAPLVGHIACTKLVEKKKWFATVVECKYTKIPIYSVHLLRHIVFIWTPLVHSFSRRRMGGNSISNDGWVDDTRRIITHVCTHIKFHTSALLVRPSLFRCKWIICARISFSFEFNLFHSQRFSSASFAECTARHH